MNKENVVLGFAIGFFLLALISPFAGISTHILTVISLSSALFALAQAIENNLAAGDEERKKMFDVFSQANNLSKEWLLFGQRYSHELFSTKTEKNKQSLATVIECSSVVILIVGMAIPVKVFEIEWISRMSTIIPFGFLFLSIWQLEKSRKKIRLWEEIQLFSMIFQNSQPDNPQSVEIVDNTTDRQA